MTAILDPLCADLCNAVTGQNEGQVMLERLEQLNLFIRPLDDLRHHYRYQPLFADFLRECLARQGMGDMSGLHLRASAGMNTAATCLPPSNTRWKRGPGNGLAR